MKVYVAVKSGQLHTLCSSAATRPLYLHNLALIPALINDHEPRKTSIVKSHGSREQCLIALAGERNSTYQLCVEDKGPRLLLASFSLPFRDLRLSWNLKIRIKKLSCDLSSSFEVIIIIFFFGIVQARDKNRRRTYP